jgi:hypothetical protein
MFGSKAILRALLRLCTISMLVLASPLGAAMGQSADVAVEATPDTITQEFYQWYLGLLVDNKDPMHEEAAVFSKYVSGALTREIEKKIHSADGMEADYFMRAQDYLDDWPGNVSVIAPHIKGSTATVVVSLGAATPSRYRLKVTLAREQGAWKIRKVSRLNP